MNSPYAYSYSPVEGSSTGTYKGLNLYTNFQSHDVLIDRFVTTLLPWIGWV